MKLFTGCWALSLGLILAAESANAQVMAPSEIGGPAYRAVSDFSGPDGVVVPPEVPAYAAPPRVPPYAAVPLEIPEPAYGPALLPPAEVYAILRETGFLPLGIPRQRGMFYVIAVTNRYGEEGRLVIDARTGQIVRFVPTYGMGDVYGAAPVPYATAWRLQALGDLRDPPRPPASVPRSASRSTAVPIPKAAPPRTVDDKPLAEKPAPQPPQQSAAVQPKPADAPPLPRAAPPPAAEAKPTAQIQPTQPMPQVQGLE